MTSAPMYANRSVPAGGLVLIALLVVSLAGCDNTVEPFATETGLFSVYGYISMSSESNLIRVKDLNDPLVADSTREIDAEVTLTNLSDGTTEVLRDTIHVFEEIATHNFLSRMPIEPETTYRLTVERSDGARSETTATTPGITDVEVWPQGEQCLTPHRVTFHGVSDAKLVRASVGFYYRGERTWVVQRADDGQPVQVTFSPEDIMETYIPLQNDPDVEHIYTPRCGVLDVDTLYIAYTHLGPDWLQFEQPFNPLESATVEDGLGFFGALRRDTLAVPIDTTEIRLFP